MYKRQVVGCGGMRSKEEEEWDEAVVVQEGLMKDEVKTFYNTLTNFVLSIYFFCVITN